MARVYDENGKIVGTTESQDIRLNQSNELYKGDNLDEVLKELAKVFTIEEQIEKIKLILGYDKETELDADIIAKINELNNSISSKAPIYNPKFTGAISLGRKSGTTIGTNSVAEGNNVTASGKYSHAEGDGTKATGSYSHAEGCSATASGFYTHAEGAYTTASGDDSHTEGLATTSLGNYSHAEGTNTTSKGMSSHSEGKNTTALGDYSHVEGYSSKKATSAISDLSTSTANSDIITAWNSNNFSLAKGESSHVEGMDNLALGKYSHAEGGRCIAYNEGHAEGCECIAGNENIASLGYGYHAEGYKCVASGTCSHAEGNRTIASGENQHIQGRLNIEDTENKYAHIVGNGSPASGERSNAHTLDWNGNAWYAGELYTGGTSQADGNKVLTTADISFNEAGELVVTINGVTKTFVPKSE